MFSRRDVLRIGGLGLAGASLAREARAAGDPGRKFLFVFCYGGWDTTYVFSPMFGNPSIDVDPEATLAEVGGISFADAASRPSVRGFFERWAERACVINGIQVHSIAHSVCLRDIMTGALEGADDWAAILAASGGSDLLLPMIHLSGPSYTEAFGGDVVRVGQAGQLSALVDGSALSAGDTPRPLPSPHAEALEDAWALARANDGVRRASRGRASALAAQAVAAEERLAGLAEVGADVAMATGVTLVERASIVSELFERGLSRCGMVQYDGRQGIGWDTHGGNASQSDHFEELFASLSTILQDLSSRAGTDGGASLADETTVVVLSEMNRFPKLNSRDGKDHWAYTSAMLVGAGVRGGQVVGGYDDRFAGRPIDLGSGEAHEGGTALGPGHLGATLLALGGVDPAEYIGDAEAIQAVIG